MVYSFFIGFLLSIWIWSLKIYCWTITWYRKSRILDFPGSLAKNKHGQTHRMLWDHSKLTRTVLIFCCKLHFHLLAMRIKLSLLIMCSGYIAPEYLYRGEISAQSNIYSLGLLIIETTTGEKNNPKQNEPSAREFIERVRKNTTCWFNCWSQEAYVRV